MKYFHSTIELHLRKIAGRWKGLRLLQHTGTLGIIACLLIAMAGIGMWRGWLQMQNPYVAMSALVIVAVAAVIAWLVVLVVVLSGFREPRSWLAGKLEKSYSPLLDRLNTLVFLGEKKQDITGQSYFKRIEKQASTVLTEARPQNPFSVLRPLLHFAAFAVVLAGTIWFYSHFHPWERLMAVWHEREKPVPETALPPELKLPDTNVSEEKKEWSEVRITDPATDTKATKVDVVPLEIEAASSQSLSKVSWALSVDGGKEQPRPLDAPAEPHYAVYQPVLALDELQLSDWDVVSYYAKAGMTGGASSSSELYFIEIRPFREDILKMPGGEKGKAMGMLGELTSLIERQRLILRQTHHYEQQPSTDAKTKEGDQKKLVDAESELGESVTHFYAETAAQFENKAIGDTLDHLALAGSYIDRATGELRNDFAGQAVPLEQGALTELAATRKNFQKFINEHPDQFNEKDASPVADTGQTEKIAEFRNAEKAASDFLQKTVEKQKDLAEKAKSSKPGGYGGMQKEQDDLAKSVSDFESQNPELFKDLDKQTAAADAAMKKASTAFKTAEARNKLIAHTGGVGGGSSPSASGTSGTNAKPNDGGASELPSAEQLLKMIFPSNSKSPGPAVSAATAKHIDAMQEGAVSSLDELKNAFTNANTTRQIEHAHELKKMLEQQAGHMEQAGAGQGSGSAKQLQQAAQNASQTVGQLKDIVNNTGAGKAFGQPLHDALSGAQQGKLDGQLAKLSKPQDATSRQSDAKDAANSLRDIGQAFEKSLPSTLQQARQSNPLTPGSQEAFDQAMKELESMGATGQGAHPLQPESEAKQREDARLSLIKSIPELYGNNEATKALLTQVDLDLKQDGKPINVEALKKLMDQIQNFRTELDEKKMEKPDKAEISHTDLSKLPPEYRERVERYFQKLSEQ